MQRGRRLQYSDMDWYENPTNHNGTANGEQVVGDRRLSSPTLPKPKQEPKPGRFKGRRPQKIF